MANLLRTPICDLLGIEYPILLAGMGGASGPTLAAAVSNAGGLGVIGATRYSPDELSAVIRKTRSLTSKPFAIDLLLPSSVAEGGDRQGALQQIPDEHKRFIDELREEFGLPKAERPPTDRAPLSKDYYKKQVEVILEERVPVFASGLGNPGWLVPDAHAIGMKVIGLVGNVKNARRVADGGADIVVAQGHEAGGHTGRIGTLALVPQVVDAIAPTAVVAAGGVFDGRGLVASLALGAQGVWVGTAFLVAEEAYADGPGTSMQDEWQIRVGKQKLIDATEEDTRVGRMYSGKTMRHLRNAFSDAWERPGAPAPLPMPLQGMLIADIQEAARREHREDFVGGPAGQAAGALKAIRPASEIMRDMIEGAQRVIEAGLVPLAGAR